MKLNCEDYDQVSVVTVQGDLTADHTEEMRRVAGDRLDKGQARDFVIDLSEVEFVDSQALETLLWLQETCGEALGQVRLVGAQPNVSKILEITRLAARFDCHHDVDAALRSLR
jgi:stage II sporulation protein AA (anti-sigma F factor antagonist)